MKDYITIIGAGLAGCEAAYQISKRGFKVKLYEMKPIKFSPAHTNSNFAEVVCSNSFKSNLLTNACGLLKEELRRLDSLLIKTADKTCVPAGQALAVDREIFSNEITEAIEKNENIEIIRKEVISKFDTNDCCSVNNDCVYFEDLIEDGIVIIATGPLTSDSLSIGIKKLTGEADLHFYDAQAPIVEKDSIDFDIAFYGNRYDFEKNESEEVEKSYINLPMNKEEYEKFIKELINAEVVMLREFEKREIFEGCMPIEIMAKRGEDTLRFGPLKPVGFKDPRDGNRPYAIVQLRQDNAEATLYNIVGFQTNLKWGEQKRVFSMIPGLANADFVKYGVMHRNTFINSTKLLDRTYNFKPKENIYFAGQITGVEGYVESISSGLVASINACKQLKNKKQQETSKNAEERLKENNTDVNGNTKIIFDERTMIGCLAKYISTPNEKFQPMNANYGILPPLNEKIRDKKIRYEKLSQRALSLIDIEY